MFPRRITCLGCFLLLGCFSIAPALADPPEWAPAHGWRKKPDRDDDYRRERHRRTEHREEVRVGYEGRRWPSDYGILRSQCNRETVGAVLGGVVGGVVGSQMGKDEGRVIATVIGSIVGAVVGAQIGRSMDEGDRACVGHALELADTGRAVHWTNEENHAQYALSPLGDYARSGQPCCEFSLEVTSGSRQDASIQRACRSSDGAWVMQPG